MDSEESARLLQWLTSTGWLFIPGTLGIDPQGILSMLGPIIPTRWGSPYLDLVPHTKDSASPASMSSMIGMDEQPMHTDSAYSPLPPKYLALQCINPGEASCPTHVWEFDVDRLKGDRPTVMTDVRWIARGGGLSQFYCSVMDVERDEVRLRFDRCCMVPIDGDTGIASETSTVLEAYSRRLSVDWQTGSILVLNNWRCLHARGLGADKSPSRSLRRWNVGVEHGLVT